MTRPVTTNPALGHLHDQEPGSNTGVTPASYRPEGGAIPCPVPGPKGTLSVPNTSELLRKACMILLLLEGLRTQRADLRPVPLRSLLGLGGGRSRRRTRAMSTLDRLRGELDVPETVDNLDLVAFALSLAPEAIPTPPPGQTTQDVVETSIRRFQTEGFDLFEQPSRGEGPTVPIAEVVPFTGPGPRRGRRRDLGGFLSGLFTSPAVREAVCGVAAPVLLSGLPLIRAPDVRLRLVGLGAMAALSGCGFDLAEFE